MPVWTLLLLVIGFLRIHITAGGIIEARCKLYCLESVQMSNSSHSIESCESNLNCSSCLFPCGIQYKSRNSCEVNCESASSFDWCLESCSFLKLLSQQNHGACPALEDIAWSGRACLEECTSDVMCKSGQKCCFNGCGHTCQRAVIERGDYPPRPAKNDIIVEENDDALSVRIAWPLKKPPDPGEQILFAVEGRNHSGEKFRKKHVGPWTSVRVTHREEINVPLEVGRYYQFRVAVVNINGSHGYSRPTHAITLSRNPTKPNPPENLRKGRSVLSAHGKVNIVIDWDAPKPSDMEIIKYKVFWSERVDPSPFFHSLVLSSTTIRAPQTSCELVGLKLGTKYVIEVMSMAKWGSVKQFSVKKNLLIRTERFDMDKTTAPIISTGDGPGPVENIAYSTTYWFEDNLYNEVSWTKPKGYESIVDRFTIHWKPAYCNNETEMKATVEQTDRWSPSFPSQPQSDATVEDTRFTIYDLIFDCTYMIWIVPVSDTNLLGTPAYITMTTPPCSEVTIKGIKKPMCPTEVSDLPSAPQNVSHMFFIEENNDIAVNISWQPPAFHFGPITGYRIVWRKYLPHPPLFYRPDFPVLEPGESKTVKADCHHVILSDLDPGMRYFVMLLATSRIGGGSLAMLDIKTPIFTDFSVPPPNPKPPTASEDSFDNAEPKDNLITPPSLHPTPKSSATSPPSLSVYLSCVMFIFWCTLGMTRR
ncbi:Anosmin-1 [Holothuria leucospilota]|uniref:Anosmin-1 n=1 Tax=Holothuria leucospilota TaxID=206669 RepID=A0A9Q1BR84_HOLLE|nr:Anosmin-1 [Holothuria leucospilota]